MRAQKLNSNSSRWVGLTILIAALGYFVDIYDLLLFSIVRVTSLKELGFSGPELLSKGVLLINLQMGGMLLGGILWGVLGDRKGRVSVLFGSILLYSLANFANAFVQSIEAYAFLRLLAGIGLAGELGAGITLATELLPKDKRGYGTTVIASIGILGAVVAGLVGDFFHWRVAYMIGGALGFLILILRMTVLESGMYEKLSTQKNVAKGRFLDLFRNAKSFLRYLRVILIGLPLWFVVGILITFSPEFGKAFGMIDLPKAGYAVLFCYAGLAVGDLMSGLISQYLKSRKKVVYLFLSFCILMIGVYLLQSGSTLNQFYVVCTLLGMAAGYWAIFVTIAAEQFGTNIRATVATTVPNFVRGSVIPLTLSFQALIPSFGMIASAFWVGSVTLVLALIGLIGLEETFHKDLDYIELR